MELTQPVSGASSKKPLSREVPRLAGHGILGPMKAFRTDRVGLLLDVAARHPDIVAMPMGVARRVVVISSPSLANEVLVAKQASFLKSPGMKIFFRPVLGDGLLTSERREHERQRRLLAPSFAPKRIAGYAKIMGDRAAQLATSLGRSQSTSTDLADVMMHLTFEIVGKTLFDAELVGDAAAVGEALTTSMEVAMGQLGSLIPIPPQIPTPRNLEYRRAVKRLDEIVYRIIRERRGQTGDRGDVLSTLLEARDEDGSAMTDRQIRDEAMTLAMAGHETTANALTWTFYLLAKHPEVRAKMEAELDALDRPRGTGVSQEELKQLPYTLATFKEAMRLYPPAYLLSRRASEDVVIGGYPLKKNTIVVLNTIGIHHREDLWPEPDAFRPERFLGDREKQLPRSAYMPFGAGPRVCIGNHFALMEGHILLATLARHLRFALTSDTPAAYDPLVTLRPKGGLSVNVVAR